MSQPQQPLPARSASAQLAESIADALVSRGLVVAADRERLEQRLGSGEITADDWSQLILAGTGTAGTQSS